MRVQSTLAATLALAGAAAIAAPAAAQTYYYEPTVGEVVVTPMGPMYDRDGRVTMSRVVSYADLDLTTYGGQQILKQRIRATARDICRDLGDVPGATTGSLVPRGECVTEAVRNARGQMQFAVNRAYARTYYASLY
jgi:UrcA family protein